MARATEIAIKQRRRCREKRVAATAAPTTARNAPTRRRGSGRRHTSVCGVFAESGLVGLVVPIEREFLALDADERELGTFQNYTAAWDAVAAAAGGVITRLTRLKKSRSACLSAPASDPRVRSGVVIGSINTLWGSERMNTAVNKISPISLARALAVAEHEVRNADTDVKAANELLNECKAELASLERLDDLPDDKQVIDARLRARDVARVRIGVLESKRSQAEKRLELAKAAFEQAKIPPTPERPPERVIGPEDVKAAKASLAEAEKLVPLAEATLNAAQAEAEAAQRRLKECANDVDALETAFNLVFARNNDVQVASATLRDAKERVDSRSQHFHALSGIVERRELDQRADAFVKVVKEFYPPLIEEIGGLIGSSRDFRKAIESANRGRWALRIPISLCSEPFLKQLKLGLRGAMLWWPQYGEQELDQLLPHPSINIRSINLMGTPDSSANETAQRQIDALGAQIANRYNAIVGELLAMIKIEAQVSVPIERFNHGAINRRLERLETIGTRGGAISAWVVLPSLRGDQCHWPAPGDLAALAAAE